MRKFVHKSGKFLDGTEYVATEGKRVFIYHSGEFINVEHSLSVKKVEELVKRGEWVEIASEKPKLPKELVEKVKFILEKTKQIDYLLVVNSDDINVKLFYEKLEISKVGEFYEFKFSKNKSGILYYFSFKELEDSFIEDGALNIGAIKIQLLCLKEF